MASKYSLRVQIPGGEMALDVESQKEVFEELSFWQSLPKSCPVDGSDIRLNVRTAKANKKDKLVEVVYYELVSCGFPQWKGLIGQNLEGGTLYYPGQWVHFDGENETTVYSGGRITNQAYIDRVTGAQVAGKAAQPAQNGAQNGAQVAGKTAQPAQNGAQVAGKTAQPGAQNGAQVAGKTAQPGADEIAQRDNEQLLITQISTLFGDLDDNAVVQATPWLISRWTKYYTPGNVRSKLSTLADEECRAIAESCVQFPAKLVTDFKAWREQEKAKGQQSQQERVKDIPF